MRINRRTRGQPEAKLHEMVAGYMRISAHADVLWWHTPNNPRSAAAGARLKRMGMLAGVPDILLYRGGQLYCLELKTATGRMSPEQIDFHRRALDQGAMVYTARGFDDAVEALRCWGLVR